MKKRLFNVMFTLIMLVGLMAVMTVTASADTVTCDLSIGGVQVTDANKDNIVVPGATGSATFDPSTNTLTLNNFICSSDAFGGVINIQNGDITIKLKGNNTLTGTGEETHGIYTNGNLAICNGEDGAAKGQLTINVEQENSCINAPLGTLEITGVKVTATSTENHVLSAESISLSGVTLSAIGGWEPIYTGLVETGGPAFDPETGLPAFDPETGWPVEEYGAINIENSTVEAYCTDTVSEDYAFKSAPNISGIFAVYAGNDADSAVKVDTPTAETYTTSKYVKIVPTYPVWVGGKQFTGTNLVIDSTDSAAISGSATYNPELNTLTLNNFQYSGPGYQNEEYGYLYGALRVEGDNDLCIVFTGQNVIECTDGDEVWGLYTDFNGDLHIKAETIDSCLTFIGDVACGRVPVFDGNFVIYAGDNEADAKITAEDTFASQYYTYSYVRYEPTLMVTFDYGTLGSETKTFLNGETVTPPAPVFAGKVFAGWYDDAACTQAHDFSTPFTANDTLYAKYVNIPKRSRVSFVADGRLVGIILYRPSQTELTTVPKVPAKEGYVGTWETYTLSGKNMIVRAVYTPIN